MEKLIYILGQPEGQSVESLFDTLSSTAIPALKALGARHIRTCVRDAHVAPAAPLCGGQLAPDTWCYLALWVPSRVLHPQLGKLHLLGGCSLCLLLFLLAVVILAAVGGGACVRSSTYTQTVAEIAHPHTTARAGNNSRRW